ncbi:MAG: lysozyme inhibitor LprI family protein [Chthoniobacterales bacterium]
MAFVLAEPGVSVAGQFKRFPQTISPDGAYVLAWGEAEEKAGDTAQFEEIPFEDETSDEANFEGEVNNYLVDTATAKIVATIPGFAYFSGPRIHKNHADLDVSWSPDAKSALAICDGRWSSEAVVWIEPRTHKIVDVQKQLEKGFYALLHKNEPRFKTVEVYFSGAVIPRAGVLILHAAGAIPKEDGTSDYLLKFSVTGEGDKVQFRLENGRRLPENTTPLAADPEAELNQVYNKVRSSLSPRERDLLRDEQTRWLKLREQIKNDDSRGLFTQHRIAELRTRSESK